MDKAGAVYVADFENNRVLKLSAGSSTPTQLPFTDFHRPVGVAVDTVGDVYATGFRNGNPIVLKLPVDSTTAHSR